MMSEYEAKAIEQASMRWPLPLRQRFASARRYRTQRRWTPYRVTMNSCKQFDYDEAAAVYGLSPIVSASQCFFRDVENQMTVLRHRLRNAK